MERGKGELTVISNSCALLNDPPLRALSLAQSHVTWDWSATSNSGCVTLAEL